MTETEHSSWIWDKLMGAARVTSQRDLADKAGVSPGTVNRMVRGIGRPDVDSVRKVASVLTDNDTDLIWAAIGTGHRDYGDFDLGEVGDELKLLSPSQRRALVSVVRSMADPVGKRGRLEEEIADDVLRPKFGLGGPEPAEDLAADTEPGVPSEGQLTREGQDAAAENSQER